MSLDPKNEHTYTNLITSASYASNNAASSGFDTKEYEGSLCVLVNIGVKTAGDNDGAVSVQMQSSATNSAAAATNVSASAVVSTTNNTAAHGTIQIDPRACYRYLFARRIITGTNSPAYPIATSVLGTKQVQS